MDQFQQFINHWLTPPDGPPRHIDYDRVYRYQCVDLILEYIYELFHIPSGVGGNAIDYWDKTSPRLLEAFDKISSQDPVRGDVVVLHGLPGNPFGHIGIYTGKTTESAVEILEQNGSNGNGDGLGGNAIRTRFVPKSRIAGLLRAKDRSVFIVPTATNTNYTVLAPMPGYVNAADAAQRHNSNSQVPAGNYAVFNEYNGMVNVTRQAGSPGWWINPIDNKAPEPAHAPADAVYVTVQPGWGLERVAEAAGFHDAASPSRWQAITDLNGGGPWSIFNAHLHPGQRVMVSAAAHGEGDGTDVQASADVGIPVSEVVPAPTPAPAMPAITYAVFDAPMPLITQEGAKSYNFATGMAVENFQPGAPFEAVGKATITNSDGTIVAVYFMDKDNFSADDEPQRQPVGIVTDNLTTPSKPETLSSTASTVSYSSSTASAAPTTTSTTSSSPPDMSDVAVPWQRTMQFFMNPQVYVVKEDITTFDFATGNDKKEYKKNQRGLIGGKFTFAGNLYYRPQKAIDEGRWEGFPVTSLVKQDASNTLFHTNDDINQIGQEIDMIKKAKHAVIKAGGSADGLLARLRKRI